MMTTAAKHRAMLTSSSGMIGSLSKQHAKIEIQNGLVYQKTMIKASGASGAATLKMTKLACPVIHLQNIVHFLSVGKSYSGR